VVSSRGSVPTAATTDLRSTNGGLMQFLIDALLRNGDLRKTFQLARQRAKQMGDHDFAERLHIYEGQFLDAAAER